MSLFKFEIIQTVCGDPDPSAYPEGLSHTPALDGAAKVVYMEFRDETEAQRHACCHEDGWQSDVWNAHCPPHFKASNSVGGLDVYYIGPATEAEIEDVSSGDFWVTDPEWQRLMEEASAAEWAEFEQEREREEEERHVLFERIERASLRRLKKRSR